MTPAPIPGDFKVTGISRSSSKVGETPKIRVSVNKINSYIPGFSVKIGGYSASIGYTRTTYFEFKLPSGLTEGTYEIVVNNGIEKVVGYYTVTR